MMKVLGRFSHVVDYSVYLNWFFWGDIRRSHQYECDAEFADQFFDKAEGKEKQRLNAMLVCFEEDIDSSGGVLSRMDSLGLRPATVSEYVHFMQRCKGQLLFPAALGTVVKSGHCLCIPTVKLPDKRYNIWKNYFTVSPFLREWDRHSVFLCYTK